MNCFLQTLQQQRHIRIIQMGGRSFEDEEGFKEADVSLADITTDGLSLAMMIFS